MSAPTTTGPTRERVTRKRWEEHPTPDDARVTHVYPLRSDGRLVVEPGERAFCGHVCQLGGFEDLYCGQARPDLCVVCVDLAP